MLNQVIIVGLVWEQPKKGEPVVLKVQRNYKDEEIGEYKDDIIPIKLEGWLEDHTIKHTKIGHTIGVKARVMVEEGEMFLLGEKVTFIEA